jgi:hypothetical protein
MENNILQLSIVVAIFVSIISTIIPTIVNAQLEGVDKIQLINTVFQDASENCNLDITKYSEKTIQTSLEICKKGMAWLKIECDANYGNVPLCKENMPNIKKFLATNYFDERDIQYYHDKYNERLAMNLDTDTMTVIQEKKIGKGLQTLLDALKDSPSLNLTQIEEQEKEKEAKLLAQKKAAQESFDQLQSEFKEENCHIPLFQKSALCDPSFAK